MILLVFRDGLTVGGVPGLAITGHAVTLGPLYISNVKTFLQAARVAAALPRGAFGPVAPVVQGAPGALVGPIGLNAAGPGRSLVNAIALITWTSGVPHVLNTHRGGSGATSGPG